MVDTKTIPSRFLVYARQSVTEKKAGSHSIESHVETGRSAANEKFPGVPVFAFPDPDTSGDSELKDRESGGAMMRFAEPGTHALTLPCLPRKKRTTASVKRYARSETSLAPTWPNGKR